MGLSQSGCALTRRTDDSPGARQSQMPPAGQLCARLPFFGFSFNSRPLAIQPLRSCDFSQRSGPGVRVRRTCRTRQGALLPVTAAPCVPAARPDIGFPPAAPSPRNRSGLPRSASPVRCLPPHRVAFRPSITAPRWRASPRVPPRCARPFCQQAICGCPAPIKWRRCLRGNP